MLPRLKDGIRQSSLELSCAVASGDLTEDLARAVDWAFDCVRRRGGDIRRTGGQRSEFLAGRGVGDFSDWRFVGEIEVNTDEEGQQKYNFHTCHKATIEPIALILNTVSFRVTNRVRPP